MAQRYLHPTARERMAQDCCPECGTDIVQHGGWGGPGCLITDNGVAQRVNQYRQDMDPANLTKGEREGLLEVGRRAGFADLHPRVQWSLTEKGLVERHPGHGLEITADGKTVLTAIETEAAEHEQKTRAFEQRHQFTTEEQT